MKRRSLLAASAILPALARPAPAQPGAVPRVVAPWEIGGLDPARSGHVFQRMQVAEPLVGTDERGALRPLLAAGWRLDADRLTWRFALRAGAVFHDGTPVTAAAVAESLRRARAAASPLAQVPLAGIEAEGAEVVLRTTRPSSRCPPSSRIPRR